MPSSGVAGTPIARTFTIPSLDGIRAAAVIIVFVGHGLTLGGPWPGHVGVTVFFFLSGYLIVTLLRREWEGTGRIALSRFYLRRALRILPPAWLSIAVCVVVGALGLLPSTMSAGGVAAQLLNVTNYWMIAHGDHTGLPPESSMLWSLAVEEHYYLVIPALLIVLLSRRLGYRRAALVLAGLAVLVLLWRTWLVLDGASFYRTYTATDTRIDSMLWGSAMALGLNPALGDTPPRWLRGVTHPRVAWGAIAAFAVAAVVPGVLRLSVMDTVQCLLLVPIFWYVIDRPASALGRVLNHRWVAHLGVLSFSIYLFHKVVIALVATVVDVAPVVDVLSLLVTLAIAQAVWVGVEKPCARLRRRLETRLPEPRSAAAESLDPAAGASR